MKRSTYLTMITVALLLRATLQVWVLPDHLAPGILWAATLFFSVVMVMLVLYGYKRLQDHEAMQFKENVIYDRFIHADGEEPMDLKAFLNVLVLERERLAFFGKSSAMVLFDVDDFEKVNRRHGRTLADHMLDGIIGAVREELDGGILARVRGDAFVVLLPGADRESAQLQAERMRRAIRDLKWPGYGPVSCTFSVMPFDGDVQEQKLFDDAEALLKKGKAMGKDQVV
jgi:diguanylate cyclase (GGDEF)-like protein